MSNLIWLMLPFIFGLVVGSLYGGAMLFRRFTAWLDARASIRVDRRIVKHYERTNGRHLRVVK